MFTARSLMFVLSLMTVALTKAPLVAEEWSESLPEASIELAERLVEWETEQRRALEREIIDKRKLVMEALKKQRVQEPAGSDAEKAIGMLVSEIEETAPTNLLPFSPEERAAKQEIVMNEQEFASAISKLKVESRGAQQELAQGAMVTIEMGGKQIYRPRWKPGLHLVAIEGEAVVKEIVAPEKTGADLERYVDELKNAISSLSEDALVVIAVHRNANPYSEHLRDIVRLIGGGQSELAHIQPYICIGRKGMRSRDAIEVVGGIGESEHAVFDGAESP